MTAKEPFEYEYTMPSLDWYTTHRITIKWNDYDSFELQRRYGGEFELWLIGYKTVDDGHIRLKKTELGYLTPYYIKAFLDWCEFDFWGNKKANKITTISVISADINLFEVIDKIIKLRESEE